MLLNYKNNSFRHIRNISENKHNMSFYESFKILFIQMNLKCHSKEVYMYVYSTHIETFITYVLFNKLFYKWPRIVTYFSCIRIHM